MYSWLQRLSLSIFIRNLWTCFYYNCILCVCVCACSFSLLLCSFFSQVMLQLLFRQMKFEIEELFVFEIVSVCYGIVFRIFGQHIHRHVFTCRTFMRSFYVVFKIFCWPQETVLASLFCCCCHLS